MKRLSGWLASRQESFAGSRELLELLHDLHSVLGAGQRQGLNRWEAKREIGNCDDRDGRTYVTVGHRNLTTTTFCNV
jgi:hypothetical protein